MLAATPQIKNPQKGPRVKEGKVANRQPAANMDYFKDYDRRREAAGLTDSDVCAIAGVANSTISRARRRGAAMTRDTHKALCRAIDLIARRRVATMRRVGIQTTTN